jgi:signal transduction histidine kinase
MRMIANVEYGRAMFRRLREAGSTRTDTAVAFGLGVVAQIEIWTADASASERLLAAPLALVTCAALLLRRRVPVTVLFVQLAAIAASSAAIPLSGDDSLAFAGAVVIGIYSAGAYATGRSAIAGGVAAAIIPIGVIAGDPEGATADAYPFFLLVFGSPWVAGRALRRRRLSERRLERRAAEAERTREEEARRAVAEERARIARELHDVVAHAISVIVIQARGGRRALSDSIAESRASFDAIEKTGGDALNEMRRLLGMLRASDEELANAPQPSLAYLDDLLAKVRATGLPVELSVEGTPRELPPGVDVSAYRIVQEALTNALKHAGPSRARVVVRYTTDELGLEIVDDGAGSGESQAGGHGMIGMRERVSVFGGELTAGPRPEGGYALHARLPLDSARP